MAEAIFAEGEARYPTNVDALFAYARVRAIEKRWAKSIQEDVDYTQNEESEELAVRAANRQKLLGYWQGKLNEAVQAVEGQCRKKTEQRV